MNANNRIYLSSPHMSEEGFEMEYINAAFSSNWIAPMGANVTGFEDEFAVMLADNRDDAFSAAALVSGSAAIHLALRAAGVGAGDIVLCQDLTFAATANPIMYEHATPVFVDSDPRTWNMSPARLAEAFQKYPQAKAVIVVNLYGLCAELDSIAAICKRHNAVLIEDAAEALGSLYRGRPAGTIGDYGVFSFNGNKIITTSGGGMLVSRNRERIEKARFWSQQSRDPARHYQHSELGFNYRMSNIVAGIGRGQLRVLARRVEQRRRIFAFYRQALDGLSGVAFMPINDWNEPNCWLSCITLSGDVRPLDVMNALEAENIESRPIWKPMHMQPFFETYDCIGGEVAEALFENGLCLPSDTKLTDAQLTRIVGIIKGLF